jgi:hypothetical protein
MFNSIKDKTQADADWLAGLTDDAAKVDYMKAKVAAEQETERVRIKEREATRRLRSLHAALEERCLRKERELLERAAQKRLQDTARKNLRAKLGL